MLFCIIGTDKKDAQDLRLENRDAHLKHWGASGAVKLGGPFISDDGEKMLGSMLVIDVDDRAAAEKLVNADPYKINGVFESVEVRAWKWLLKDG